MNKLSTAITFFFQPLVTFVVLFPIYLVFALLDILEIDMIAGIGFLIFQPVLGFIISLLTMLACYLVGLPIRLNKTIRRFWLSNPLIPVAGTATGFVLLLLSFHSNFVELREVTTDYGTIQKEVPSTSLAVTGWLLTAFSLLHFYPDAFLQTIKRRKQNKDVGGITE